MKDLERGQRIKARHEELHLTEPAVVELMEELAWKLPRENPLHPETAAEKKDKDRPIPPITLRGFQSYKAGGGIAWEKAKLLAQVLQMDVQAMMSGESDKSETPDLSKPAAIEGTLAEILKAIKDQLAEQTKVLNEIKGLLGRDTKTADRLEAATESLGGTAAQLDARIQQTIRGLAAAPPPKAPAKRKTAPRRSPRA